MPARRFRFTRLTYWPPSTMLAAMSDEQLVRPRDISSLRYLSHGGSPVATETLRRAHAARSLHADARFTGVSEDGRRSHALDWAVYTSRSSSTSRKLLVSIVVRRPRERR